MLFEQFFFFFFGGGGVVSIAQLVEVTDSAVLDGVVEVVSSIPAVGHKIFSAFSSIVDLLYLSIHIRRLLKSCS